MHPSRSRELFGGGGPGSSTPLPPPPMHHQPPPGHQNQPPLQHHHHGPPQHHQQQQQRGGPPMRPPTQWVTRDAGPPRFHGGPGPGGFGPPGPGRFGGPPPLPPPVDPHVLQQRREAAERLEHAAREQAERNARFGAPPPPPMPEQHFAPPQHEYRPVPPAFPMAPGAPSPMHGRGLPLPPMPPRAAAAAPTPPAQHAITGVWRIYRTPDNTEYFFNSLTQQTQWVKPDELKTEEEKSLPPCVWSEFKNEVGVSYYSHNVTKESVWTKPPELTAWEAAKAAREIEIANRKTEQLARAPPPPEDVGLSAASVEQKLRDNQAKLLAKQEKAKRKEREKEHTPSASPPATVAASAAPVDEDPVYATKEDARAAFHSLLAEKRITSRMKNFAVDVMPLISEDVRYRALKTMPEKKKAYLAFMEEVVQLETEARKHREEEALQQFQAQLQETIEITHKSRFKTMLPILELDDRYKALHAHLIAERIASGSALLTVNMAAVLDRLEGIFYAYVDELIAAEKKLAAQRREAQCEAFRALLKEHTDPTALQPADGQDEGEVEEGEASDEKTPLGPRWITSHTSWRTLKKHSEFTADRRWMDGPGEEDRLDLFDAWMKHLTKIQREKDQLQREARRKVEKEKRQEFRQLLQEESDKLHLHARTRFKELLPHIKDDERYTGLVDWYVEAAAAAAASASSSASGERVRDREKEKEKALDKVKDIFADFVDELVERHEPLKKSLKAITKDLQLAIQPTHTPKQLSALCASHAQWTTFTTSLSSADLALLWLDLVGKVNAKISYFHSRQKDDQVKLVCKLLRTLYAQRLASAEVALDLLQDAESLTLDQCREMVRELQQPIAMPAATTSEPEELEDGEVPDDDAQPAPPVMVPRQHSASVQEGLDAWDLLEHPPLPPPASSPPGTVFTTDEYLREAFTVFHAQLRSEVENVEKRRLEKEAKRAAQAAKPDEEMPQATKEDSSSTRKRPRSTSRSPSAQPSSASRSRSPARSPKRTRTDDGPTSTAEDGEVE